MACWRLPKEARFSSTKWANSQWTFRPSCCARFRSAKSGQWAATRRIAINVRILAATNRDLEQAVAHGTFRRDLYFRLNVLSLRIPPLRERRQDIPLLAAHFLERLSRASGHERSVSDEAMKALLAHDWPGNVRELENCLERACAFTTGPMIQVADCRAPSTARPAPCPLESRARSRKYCRWQNLRSRPS